MIHYLKYKIYHVRVLYVEALTPEVTRCEQRDLEVIRLHDVIRVRY